MEGVKRKRRCEIECNEHIFAVQTLKGNSSKYDIKLQFCPKYQREPLPPEHTYPEYNDDGKFYTSAFILGVDRRVLVKNEQQELMDHQKQIRDSLEKHNQLVPIPSFRSSPGPTPNTPSAPFVRNTTKTITFTLPHRNTGKKLDSVYTTTTSRNFAPSTCTCGKELRREPMLRRS
jgi:hypothetical protein